MPRDTPRSDDPCVFCDLLISGDAVWVVSERDAVAFLPLPEGSLAPGHTLVIPRAHSIGVLDAAPSDLAATMDLAARVGRAMVAGLGAEGVVVLNASGPESGQSVAHLHLHVVPCWADDEATFWPAERSAHEVEGRPHAAIAAALEPGRE